MSDEQEAAPVYGIWWDTPGLIYDIEDLDNPIAEVDSGTLYLLQRHGLRIETKRNGNRPISIKITEIKSDSMGASPQDAPGIAPTSASDSQHLGN
jgi:hypothetical protein